MQITLLNNADYLDLWQTADLFRVPTDLES